MQRTLLTLTLAAILASPAVAATVKVENAWVRATAPGPKVAGGFMKLTADADMVLVGGASPISTSVELHFMRMEKGVMEMRQMKEIALPRAKTVSLAPGGFHVMFIDLKGRVKPGQKVPLTLVVKGSDGREQRLEVAADARR